MRRRSNQKLWLALLIAGGLLLGCAAPATDTLVPSSPTPPAELDEVEQTLDQMEETWKAQSLADYRFQFRWECFCPPGFREPVWVSVIAGEIESVRAVEPDLNVNLPDKGEYRTIDGLFDLLRDAVAREAYEIEVSYDEVMGYPTSASIDYQQNVVDEERGFQVSEFESLE